MNQQSFEKFAAAAAAVVGLTSLLYGLVFLFLLPAAKRERHPVRSPRLPKTRPLGKS